MRYAIEARATYKRAKNGYGRYNSFATKRIHETAAGIHKFTLHKGETRFYGGGWIAKCNGRTELTSGNFSFSTDKTWNPREGQQNLEELALLALLGKGVPEWAYRAKPCAKCFKLPTTKVECNLGSTHTIVKDDYERMVGGRTGWSPYREGPDNYGNQSLRFYPEGP